MKLIIFIIVISGMILALIDTATWRPSNEWTGIGAAIYTVAAIFAGVIHYNEKK